jgi:hypothetical protein
VVRSVHDFDDDDGDDEPAKRVSVNNESLEAIPGESAARARKNLRRDIEEKLAEGSWQFPKAFEEVD